MAADQDTQNPHELRKQGKFAEAIPIYEEQTRANPSAFNFRWLINCHRKAGKPGKAHELCMYALRKFPEDKLLMSEMAWIIYDLEIKTAKEDHDFKNLVEASRKAIGFDPQNDLLVKVVGQAVMKLGKQANNPNWKTIAEFALKIDPETLSSDKRESSTGKPFMSEREEWYVNAVKALLESNNLEGVHHLASKGLKDFPRQIDLSRYVGQAQYMSGDLDEAGHTYELLLTYPRIQWYVVSEAASIKAKKGKIEQACQLFAQALQTGNEDQFMIGTMEEFATVLIDQGKLQEAQFNLALARKIREELQWRIPPTLSGLEERLQQQARTEGVELSELPSSIKELKRVCSQTWKKGESEGLDYQKGKVGDVFPERKYTFIKPEGGGESVFVLIKDLPRDCQQWGSIVEFVPEKSFDTKKNKESFKAIRIRKAKSE